MVLAAMATVPIIVLQEQGNPDPLVALADWVAWSVFAVDYVVLLALSADRSTYVRSNWLAAAIVLLSFPAAPPLLATLRLARLSRVFRLLRLVLVAARFTQGLRIALGRPGLAYVAGVSGMLILAAGGLLTILEPETVKGDYWTGVWWAVVTTTTVGYGDVFPVTPEGRALAAVLMFTGLGLVATLSASIAAYFVRRDTQEEEGRDRVDLEAVMERLDRIESMLAARQALDGAPEEEKKPHA